MPSGGRLLTDILVFFHCPSNSGYAIARLERAFLEMARRVTGTDDRIHFAYPKLAGGHPEALPAGFRNVIAFNPGDGNSARLGAIEEYVRQHGIRLAFGFDQPVRRPGFRALRRGGVQTLVSYWGAPMSSLNHGLKLALKRLDVRLARFAPDHFIFESKAMWRTAVEGRGIPPSRASITYLGVDPSEFRPLDAPSAYAHEAFRIPKHRRIVYYAGHMEERKGVHVLVRAAVELVDRRGMQDVHFLLLGNQPGEEARFGELYHGTKAEGHITFGGYRQDVAKLLPCCHVGAIASTGWDSFTMSSLEMAACGLPLVVSRLQGLEETVDDGQTGFTFPVGDHEALADRLVLLLTDEARFRTMSVAARRRVMDRFTIEHQVASLVATVRRVAARDTARSLWGRGHPH